MKKKTPEECELLSLEDGLIEIINGKKYVTEKGIKLMGEVYKIFLESDSLNAEEFRKYFEEEFSKGHRIFGLN